MQLKDEDSALKELEKARLTYPYNRDLILTIIQHYTQLKQEDKIIPFLEEMVQKDSNNGLANAFLYEYYLKNKGIDKAFPYLQRAIHSDNIDLDTKMKLLINTLENPYSNDNRVIQLAKEMTDLYPEDAKSHSIYADFLLKTNRKEEALKKYKKAAEIDPTKFPIWNQILWFEYELEKFEDLAKDAQKCLEFFPSSPEPYLFYGISQNKTNHFEVAKDYLFNGIELVFDNPSILVEFYHQLGISFFGLKDYNSAKKYLEKSLAIQENNAPVLELLGDIYAIKGNIDKALNYWEKASTMNTSNELLKKKIQDKQYYEK